ncbi:ATP-binding protein [Alistipes sp. OttesenSCG-928-B03]|nr:ATP-binding protein [Alistipes sp. OttesenSCG-928-B03]
MVIGKVVATEKVPTTIDNFCFWTDTKQKLSPFDVVVVPHFDNSKTYGVIEEISHITDSPSYLTGYISSDFGDVEAKSFMDRIGMNYVKARVVGNTKNVYIPVVNGASVSLGNEKEVREALGLDKPKNPLPCGYLEMSDGKEIMTIPVHFNSHFLIGPEGAHLNISGISGLAAKTSYAMFLMKAIQDEYSKVDKDESVAFVMLNVKGKDLLAIDEPNSDPKEFAAAKEVYEKLGLKGEPFKNVKYFYPYSKSITQTTYAVKDDVERQIGSEKGFQFKYIFEEDKESINALFASVDDPQETMESIFNYIITEQGKFSRIDNWEGLKSAIYDHTQAGAKEIDKNISVLSWRKFYRIFNKSYEKNKSLFAIRCDSAHEVRLRESIQNIKKNDVLVVDVAKLDEETQGFVFSDVMRAIYDLKLSSDDIKRDKDSGDVPSRIIIFIDELNKYASKEIPKNSPILKQLLDITERGRSLGIVLFAAEQFKSDIHDRVKGNCATHAYGRTNAIEVSKKDYQYVPKVYQNMLTRLEQGQYILQNPIFRSLLNIRFPLPIYKQYK